MLVTLKLFATLSEHLPAGAVRNAVACEVGEGATVRDVLDRHGVPMAKVHLILINGVRGAGRVRCQIVAGRRCRLGLATGSRGLRAVSVDAKRALTDHTDDAGAAGLDASSREIRTEVVPKIMALSEPEFCNGIAALQALRGANGEALASGGHALPVRFALDKGHVDVRFEPLPERRLGGLLRLPQARVTLTFVAAPLEVRSSFLAQFWVVFQRGGG